MNGVRARLPELLLWLLGLGGVAATTALMRSADWLVDIGTLDSGPSLPTELALAAEFLAPTVITAGLAVLLVRAGHRALATALAAAWLAVVGLEAACLETLWWLLPDDVDGGPSLGPLAVLGATNLAIVLGPVVLARRTCRDTPATHAHASTWLPWLLGLLTPTGLVVASHSQALGDLRPLVAVVVTATAALVADRRRPDVVTLAHLAGMYLAWRLVVLGFARPEGLGTVIDDVVLLVAATATALVVALGPRALAAVRTITSRGPRLWGPAPAAPRAADDTGLAPIAAATPRTPAAPLPVRALALTAAVALTATGVVAWVAHGRSDGIVARRLADARSHIGTLDAALPAGWRTDPTGTACGSGEWTWCATTDAAPADAARVAADALAAAGRDIGTVTCPDTRREEFVVRPSAPIMVDAWSDPCTASRRDGDVGVAVVAARTLRSALGNYPPVPQHRTAVAVGAWSNRADDGYRDGSPWPAARREPEIAGLPALLAPAGWRGTLIEDAAGTEAGDPAPTVEPADGHDRTLRVRIVPPETITPAEAVRAVGAHLLEAGFRVEVGGCDDRGCRVLANRWALPDRTGPEFVMGSADKDGSVALGVSLG